MQRIQRFIVLTTALLLTTGCMSSDLGKPLTVGEYLHDYDLMESVINRGRSDPGKYSQDPAFVNASAAYSEIHGFGTFRKCWPRGVPPSTANTDQSCVDTLISKYLR